MSVDGYLWFAFKSSRIRHIRGWTQSAGSLPFLVSVPGNQPALAQTNAGQDALLQHVVDGPCADVEALGDVHRRHAGAHRWIIRGHPQPHIRSLGNPLNRFQPTRGWFYLSPPWISASSPLLVSDR